MRSVLQDWQVPLGRRFRSLKLWFVLRTYGQEGLQKYLRHHISLARQFAEWIAEDDRFEIAAEQKFSLVCFRLKVNYNMPHYATVDLERYLQSTFLCQYEFGVRLQDLTMKKVVNNEKRYRM